MQSPISAMEHHVLHVDRAQRVPVLVDLTSAPGRTMVFTRTKRGAKVLARQLNQSGVPAVEMHGNLSQGARTRNLESFHAGRATTMVATDIAARGIHVDDVTLVVHADPPAEHKAYLHRSGRTARAGAAGTVVTLMTSDQVRDVRALSRAAGISPRTTVIDGAGHPVLVELAPGERTIVPGGLGVSADDERPRSSGRGRPAAAAGPARVVRAAPAAAEAAVTALPAVVLRRPAGLAPARRRGAGGSGKGGGAKSGGGQRRRGGNGGGAGAVAPGVPAATAPRRSARAPADARTPWGVWRWPGAVSVSKDHRREDTTWDWTTRPSTRPRRPAARSRRPPAAPPDDESLEAEGRADQSEANVKQAGDKVKDAADDVKDAFKR